MSGGFYVNGTNINTLFKSGTVAASTNGGFRLNNIDVKSTLKATQAEQSAVQTYFRILNSDLNTIFRDFNFTDVAFTIDTGPVFGTDYTSSINGAYTVLSFLYASPSYSNLYKTFTINFKKSVVVSYLVVGGGGGGGSGTYFVGSGAGGGEVKTGSFTPILNSGYQIVVGAGGFYSYQNSTSPPGNTSSFNGTISTGGGCGLTGGPVSAYTPTADSSINGCGGTCRAGTTVAAGNKGGAALYAIGGYTLWSGGGGSTAGFGSAPTSSQPSGGTGGPGTSSSITGTAKLYGGGGGGAVRVTSTNSSLNAMSLTFSTVEGGGGKGGYYRTLSGIYYSSASNGINGTGGGGGGGEGPGAVALGGYGGHGIVILSFLT